MSVMTCELGYRALVLRQPDDEIVDWALRA